MNLEKLCSRIDDIESKMMIVCSEPITSPLVSEMNKLLNCVPSWNQWTLSFIMHALIRSFLQTYCPRQSLLTIGELLQHNLLTRRLRVLSSGRLMFNNKSWIHRIRGAMWPEWAKRPWKLLPMRKIERGMSSSLDWTKVRLRRTYRSISRQQHQCNWCHSKETERRLAKSKAPRFMFRSPTSIEKQLLNHCRDRLPSPLIWDWYFKRQSGGGLALINYGW